MEDFFSIASFATLGGSTIVVVAISNAVRHAFNWGSRKAIFILSIIVAIVALQISVNTGDQSKTVEWYFYLIAVGNGALIYLTAFGIQGGIITTGSSLKPQTEPELTTQSVGDGEEKDNSKRLTFRSPW